MTFPTKTLTTSQTSNTNIVVVIIAVITTIIGVKIVVVYPLYIVVSISCPLSFPVDSAA